MLLLVYLIFALLNTLSSPETLTKLRRTLELFSKQSLVLWRHAMSSWDSLSVRPPHMWRFMNDWEGLWDGMCYLELFLFLDQNRGIQQNVHMDTVQTTALPWLLPVCQLLGSWLERVWKCKAWSFPFLSFFLPPSPHRLPSFFLNHGSWLTNLNIC